MRPRKSTPANHQVPSDNPAIPQQLVDPASNPWRRRATHWLRVAAAMVLLAAITVAQRLVSMPRWSAVLGRPASVPNNWPPSPVISLPTRWDSLAEHQVAQAVRSARRHLPWTPKCLPEAATAQILLRATGQPAVVVIGLRPPPASVHNSSDESHGPSSGYGRGSASTTQGRWEAHAWLVGKRGAITGGLAARGFTPTTVFEVPGGLTAAEVILGQSSPDGPAGS